MQLLGPKDIGALLGVHERTAIRLFEDGEILAFQIPTRSGRLQRWRTTRDIYDAWLKEKLDPGRVNALTAAHLNMRVLFRDRKRTAVPL